MATKPAKTAALRWTRADLARLPDDGNRYEVLDGKLLVTPQASYGQWIHLPRPVLVAEVLSDSTRRRDLGDKRDAYVRRRKIPDYWIVDLDERRVLTWRPDSAEPEVVSDVLRWQPRAEFPPLEIRVDSLLPPREGIT